MLSRCWKCSRSRRILACDSSDYVKCMQMFTWAFDTFFYGFIHKSTDASRLCALSSGWVDFNLISVFTCTTDTFVWLEFTISIVCSLKTATALCYHRCWKWYSFIQSWCLYANKLYSTSVYSQTYPKKCAHIYLFKVHRCTFTDFKNNFTLTTVIQVKIKNTTKKREFQVIKYEEK